MLPGNLCGTMKTLRITLIIAGSWLLWLTLSQFFFCSRFAFNTPAPFEGPAIYNPYDSIEPKQWMKCNFHAHAHCWNGITNGHGTAKDIHRAYDSLGYNVHTVSNYHYIDTTFSANDNYISAYEHGYNLRKTHQLVLGSENIRWLDYLLPQTMHNKQHVLNSLYHEPNTVVILNHPALRNGYTGEDLSVLTNYDCMEVLNPAKTSETQWDAALSAGKKVFIVGNDDLHNVIEKDRLGVICTFVNVGKMGKTQVLEALKNGQSYGVRLGPEQHFDSIPFLKYLTVSHDTLRLQMSEKAEEITFTGQEGRVLGLFKNSSAAAYKLNVHDHYARATVRFASGTTILLNPVFFTPEKGYQETPVYEDWNETLLYRSIGIGITLLWFLVLGRLLPGNRGWGGSVGGKVLLPWQRQLARRGLKRLAKS